MRQGDWKLIERYEGASVELFNLQLDPGEQHDLTETELERTRVMVQQLRDWRASVGAKMPKPNPNFKKSTGT
jgi:arylsulfatase A